MSKAFSLIEIIIALAILSILSTLAMSSWHYFQQNQRADQAIQSLLTAVHTAQTWAVLNHQSVSLCPSLDQTTCQLPWDNGLLLFFNPLHHDQPMEAKAIIEQIPLNLHRGHLIWRHFSLSKTLDFDASGTLISDNGTFIYCPQGNDPHFVRAFTLNKMGRSRMLLQRNTSGQLIDLDGVPIVCPSI